MRMRTCGGYDKNRSTVLSKEIPAAKRKLGAGFMLSAFALHSSIVWLSLNCITSALWVVCTGATARAVTNSRVQSPRQPLGAKNISYFFYGSVTLTEASIMWIFFFESTQELENHGRTQLGTHAGHVNISSATYTTQRKRKPSHWRTYGSRQ